jgi:hypothetical protein
MRTNTLLDLVLSKKKKELYENLLRYEDFYYKISTTSQVIGSHIFKNNSLSPTNYFHKLIIEFIILK